MSGRPAGSALLHDHSPAGVAAPRVPGDHGLERRGHGLRRRRNASRAAKATPRALLRHQPGRRARCSPSPKSRSRTATRPGTIRQRRHRRRPPATATLATLGAKNKNARKGLARLETRRQRTRPRWRRASPSPPACGSSRELGNLPPNIYATRLHRRAGRRHSPRENGAEAEITSTGADGNWAWSSLLASRPRLGQPPAPDRPEVEPAGATEADAKAYVLVGKGITFDTGGVSLKTQGSIEMKYDMLGAGTVHRHLRGSREHAAAAEPENSVIIAGSGERHRRQCLPPVRRHHQHIVGKTIEVGNTDAEGRLILCDALTHAERFSEPAALIDVATLTGADGRGAQQPLRHRHDDQKEPRPRAAGCLPADRVRPRPAACRCGTNTRHARSQLRRQQHRRSR